MQGSVRIKDRGTGVKNGMHQSARIQTRAANVIAIQVFPGYAACWPLVCRRNRARWGTRKANEADDLKEVASWVRNSLSEVASLQGQLLLPQHFWESVPTVGDMLAAISARCDCTAGLVIGAIDSLHAEGENLEHCLHTVI